jgi:hypothetical protein
MQAMQAQDGSSLPDAAAAAALISSTAARRTTTASATRHGAANRAAVNLQKGQITIKRTSLLARHTASA